MRAFFATSFLIGISVACGTTLQTPEVADASGVGDAELPRKDAGALEDGDRASLGTCPALGKVCEPSQEGPCKVDGTEVTAICPPQGACVFDFQRGPSTEGCPAAPPMSGDKCGAAVLDCNYSCGCGLPTLRTQCFGGVWCGRPPNGTSCVLGQPFTPCDASSD